MVSLPCTAVVKPASESPLPLSAGVPPQAARDRAMAEVNSNAISFFINNVSSRDRFISLSFSKANGQILAFNA
jgi:hypothetical protein